MTDKVNRWQHTTLYEYVIDEISVFADANKVFVFVTHSDSEPIHTFILARFGYNRVDMIESTSGKWHNIDGNLKMKLPFIIKKSTKTSPKRSWCL